MNKKFILRKNEEIVLVIKKGSKKVHKYFIIYRKKNNISNSRFCISINKKIGNAVVRNKLKRQIKDIISKNLIETKEDYVIILNSSFKQLTFNQKKEEIMKGII